MFSVLHLPTAICDASEIEDYLYQYSPMAANKFVDELDIQVALLSRHPFMYPAYEDDPFFRRMVLGDYILFYSVDGGRELVVVHRIFHHTRDVQPHMLG